MKKQESLKPRSVVYSFEGRWEEPLRRGEVRVFFRKRRPVILPDRVFLYLGVPVKQIIGFCQVDSIEEVDLKMAISLRKRGAITENELIKYIGEKGSVHAIHVSVPTIFQKTLHLVELEDKFGFSPPQSFSNVSEPFGKYLLGEKR